jgi:hypothetical protein
MHTATPQEVTPQWLRFAAAESYSGLGRTTLTRLIIARHASVNQRTTNTTGETGGARE